MGLVLGAAVALPVVWNLSQDDPPEVVRPVPWNEVVVPWRCEAGHSFQAAVQAGSRLCVVCEKLSYPLTEYACAVHGGFRVEVEFAPSDDVTPRMARMRLIGQEWCPIEKGLRCPLCDRALVYDRAAALQGKGIPGGT